MAARWWKRGRDPEGGITGTGVADLRAAETAAAPSFDPARMVSRNWAFIAPDVQRALDHQVIFAAGVGLASVIATLACRTGFSQFILADGDVVDVSNLNRQAFGLADIGKNKAEATAEQLRAIRPDVAVEIVPRYLDTSSYDAYLARSTLVVNSIDFDNPALFALNRSAQRRGIPCLQPLNLGWGGVVLVFTPDSPSFDTFLGLDSADADTPPPPDVLQRFIGRVFASVPGGVPRYVEGLFAEVMQSGDGPSSAEAWPNQPQLGAATALTAAMAVRAAVALTAGEPVRTAPNVNYCDLRLILEEGAGDARTEMSVVGE